MKAVNKNIKKPRGRKAENALYLRIRRAVSRIRKDGMDAAE